MFWFIAQYLFNLSLSMTSVTSNTILSSSSSLFTFALSMVVLKEPYSCAKLLSIAACIGGEHDSGQCKGQAAALPQQQIMRLGCFVKELACQHVCSLV
jgi:hypothetical protein